MDYAERTKYWVLKANQAYVYERRMIRKVKLFFIEQGDDVLRKLARWWRNRKAIKGGFSLDAIFIPGEWKEKFNEKVQADIEDAIIEMAQVYAGHGFDPTRPAVRQMIYEYMDRISSGVNSTTAKKLGETLEEGFKNGEGIEELTTRVQNVFEQATRWRARLIARTAAFGSANMGTQLGLEQGGWQRKMWLSSRDDRVRESHRIDGQVVPVNKPFILNDGREMMYPHDYNERCVHIGTDEPITIEEYK